MTFLQTLSDLALRRLYAGLSAARGPEFRGSEVLPGSGGGEGGGRAARALREANDRAWLVLELLLAGDRLQGMARAQGPHGLEPDLFGTVHSLLDRMALEGLEDADPGWRQACWEGLRTARREGLLTGGPLEWPDLVEQEGWAFLADRQGSAAFEREMLNQLADALERAGHKPLRPLLGWRTRDGAPLAVSLVAFFLLSALEVEPALFLPLGSEAADQGWDHVLPVLAKVLEQDGERLRAWLDDSQTGQPAPAPEARGAATHFQHGLSHAQAGEYERAIAELTAALCLQPDLAPALAARGDAYRLTGAYEQAVADYSAALRLEPANAPAVLHRGLAYWLLGRPDEAIIDYTAALLINPCNVAAYQSRGNAHADKGAYDTAVADYTQAIQLDPGYLFAYQDRGKALTALGRYDAAIADFSQVLRLNPLFPLAFVGRGDAYRLKGEVRRAIADYTLALRLDPLHLPAYLNRGEAYQEQDQHDRALADFHQALRLDPANAKAFYHRGITYHKTGNTNRALADFSQALRLDPANAKAFYHRALTYCLRGEPERALADFDQALHLAPSWAAAYFSRGSLFLRQGEADQALAGLSEAIRLDPDYATAYLNRALAFAQKGQLDEVIADCDQALRLDPKLVHAYLTRGTALFQKGDQDAALAAFNQALQIDPDNFDGHHRRGLLYLQRGNAEAAVADFTQALQANPNNARAYADRARVYQEQSKHQWALEDLAQATLCDSRYAPFYCAQRGLVHSELGDHDLAAADYALCLLLDPNNPQAQAWRDRLQLERTKPKAPGRRRSKLGSPNATGPVAPLPDPNKEPTARPDGEPAQEPRPAAKALPGKTPDQGSSAVPLPKQTAPPEETAPPPPVLGELTEEAAPVTGDTVEIRVEEPAGEEPSPPELEEESPAPEPAEELPSSDPVKEESRQREEAAHRRHLLEEYHRKQVEEARQRKTGGKAKARPKVPTKDTGEARPLWQWAAVVAATALLVGGAFLFVPSRKTEAKGPPTAATLTAAEAWEEYFQNPPATNCKYGNQLLVLSGTVAEVVVDRRGPRLLLETPKKARWSIECVFVTPDDVKGMNKGQVVTVRGEVEPRARSDVNVQLFCCKILKLR